MSRSANVLSIQTLKDFKLAMCLFAEDARSALSNVDMELRRTRDWLERDQLGYWQSQIKKRSEDLMQARADLHKRKISQQGSEAVSDAEQKEALREAQKRLRAAEEKVVLIRRLIPQLHHAIDEYHSHSQPLGDHLTGGFERSLATIERMVLSLEAYVATTAPSAPRLDDMGGGGSTGPASTTSGSTTAEPAAENGPDSTAAPAAVAEVVTPAGEPLTAGKAS